jgi:hypothetical protein
MEPQQCYLAQMDQTILDQMSPEQLRFELQRGAKFVQYQYCISILVMTFKRFSKITYIAPEESATIKGLGFTLLTLVAGWWGIPWGPIWTIEALWVNLRGGKDLTPEIAARLGVATATAAAGK